MKTSLICIWTSLRKQPSFIASGPNGVSREGPSRETPFGPGAMKDGCFRRLHMNVILFLLKEWARRLALRKRLTIIQKSFKWGSERNIKGISWYTVWIVTSSPSFVFFLVLVIESLFWICLRLLSLGLYGTFISYWLRWVVRTWQLNIFAKKVPWICYSITQ